MQDKILGFIRLGSYVETAVIAAGVTKSTFYSWLRVAGRARRRFEEAAAKGIEDKYSREELPLVEFLHSVEKAANEADLLDLSEIRKASATQWQAAAWRLERRHPKLWGRQDLLRQEISGPDGGPLPVENAEDSRVREAVHAAYKHKVKREVMRELGLLPGD